MQEKLKEQFELANKMIFVKAYDRGKSIFDAMLTNVPINDENLIVHLRRIELSAKLNETDQLIRDYKEIEQTDSGLFSQVCVLLCQQYGELSAPTEILKKYQLLLQEHGPHHCLYFGLGLTHEMQENWSKAKFYYEQSIQLNINWYPSLFGLSQVCYNSGHTRDGDHNFFLFEKLAPYNVYGNFETHRELYQEFFDLGHYEEAKAAIETLSQWWHENKGRCPDEIQIFEYLASAQAEEAAGMYHTAQELRVLAEKTADYLLEHSAHDVNMLYFLARIFDEFNNDNYSSYFYQAVLSNRTVKTEVVQRIGTHLISRGQIDKALAIFGEAHRNNPENLEIRFCLLVGKLKTAKIDIESFLNGKERLRSLLAQDQDNVESLALLHSLLAQFDEDSELHSYMGDLHLKLGNLDRAKRHFEKMYTLDPYSVDSILRLANFYVEIQNPSKAQEILATCDTSMVSDTAKKTELQWLMANIAQLTQDHQKAISLISSLQKHDAWNISYLIQRIKSHEKLLVKQGVIDGDMLDRTQIYDALLSDDREAVDWQSYWTKNQALKNRGLNDLVYLRTKLGFMFESSGMERVRRLMDSAIDYNIEEGCRDFLALVNTNFDSAEVYWGLGKLHKELWQLEVSTMWLQIGLDKNQDIVEYRSILMAELADNYLWQEQHKKAIEYAQISMDLMKGSRQLAAVTTLSHAYLKNGDMQKAAVYLDMIEADNSFDSVYLRGLVQYRNGQEAKAKKIWKPLIQQASMTPRVHYMKQQLMRFYYEASPYLKTAN